MNLLEDLKMTPLDFNFVIIYIIDKMLALLKNHLNYLIDCILEYCLKEYNRLLFLFFKNYFFSQHKMMESLKF